MSQGKVLVNVYKAEVEPCLQVTYKAHISNIHALNSDTNTLRIQYKYTQRQCVGVAIAGMDLVYGTY